MRKNALITLAALLGSGLCAAQAPAFEAVDLLDYSGAEIFGRFCASCHGDEGRGDGPVAPSLRTVVPDLTRINVRYGDFPRGQIADTIDGRSVVISAHGTRSMPVWGYEFWVEEGADIEAEAEVRTVIARLIDFIRSIQVGSDD
jgi:mono/diheme cytochrome c family protein